ncbi:MAG: fumarylacetoacetate hydrolase family protein [Chloroflexi bacterium]|nr:fumarylacetoacetate hydrolase family protein [Chloroflexota bacterium]
MRLATFEVQGLARLGAVVGSRVVDLAAEARHAGGDPLPSDMLAFLDNAVANLERTRRLLACAGPSAGQPLDAVRLLAPIPRPRQNVLCVGRNYLEHIAEGARTRGEAVQTPEHPAFFTKRATAVIGPAAPIRWDAAVTAGLDWEAELAVVIGRPGRDIPSERAYEYVFGYACANDVSARDVQHKRHGGQWFRGKSLDDSCPLGPWIVTSDELPNPHGLRIACCVNGALKQDANTADMIFDIPTLIAELSAGLTLEPGDILLTGTPSGVGCARAPQEFLRPGDVVEVEIEGLGVLRNPVVTAERR